MENVADALKMAADVLVFVMALGISIASFSQAKQTAQIIVEFNDREYSETQYAEDVGQTDRIVGVESIIPTIWRAFNENIRVVFYENDNGSPDNSEPMQLYNLYNKDNKSLVIKTLAQISDYKYRGIGSYLVEYLHQKAQLAGYNSIIHALMHKNNVSANILSGELYHKYKLYGVKL